MSRYDSIVVAVRIRKLFPSLRVELAPVSRRWGVAAGRSEYDMIRIRDNIAEALEDD